MLKVKGRKDGMKFLEEVDFDSYTTTHIYNMRVILTSWDINMIQIFM